MRKGGYVFPLVNINNLPRVNLVLGLEKSNTRTEIIHVKKIDVCISSAAVEGTVKAGPIFKETPRLGNWSQD